ncbi:hypothetical protein [Glycomyces algeriensis]|uniref:Uncharacterized protein n=1 Tax=Glycomyces algeriensis TaxID=256037 RepID=A0A9W6G5V5_9ACTN|nr:hypothetical protein [Glycomyces algeriensis]MDA1367235.1 hypothetical protein [Glycomyces algeriensis]MDR7353381.1 hypothetical protein [Glycomyces algeriensis]GLI41076.1 hypothetical protein GALLR39Z86_09260 [Glycomyces algeriensis]
MNEDELVAALSVAIDPTLAKQLIGEATQLEEAFALRKWKYSELDGGRFAEVAARILYSVDSGNLNLTKGVDQCLGYLENDQVSHAFPERQAANHMARVLRAIYKLRSQRGAVHVSPTYEANEIDSRLIVESARWVLADLLRLFVTTDRAVAVEVIKELSRFPQPLIRNYGGLPLLQSVSFTTEEEVLVHLLHARDGLSIKDLISAIPKAASGVRQAVIQLSGAKVRQITKVKFVWQITDLGITRIETRILQEHDLDREPLMSNHLTRILILGV